MSEEATIDEIIEQAVLNHDRLVEENKNLKDKLESLEDDYKNEFNASEDLRCEKEDLTEENKRLRGFVKKVAELDIETLHFETQGGDEDYIEYICTDIVDDANELLSELGGE